jgi:hypothetical protein
MIIDTKNKTVQLDDETIGEVVKQLQSMVPDWADYKFAPKIVSVTIREKEYENPFKDISPGSPYNPVPYPNPYPIWYGAPIMCQPNTCEGSQAYWAGSKEDLLFSTDTPPKFKIGGL